MVKKPVNSNHKGANSDSDQRSYFVCPNGGPVVNPIVRCLPRIGQPSPTARSLQSQIVTHVSLHGGTRRDAFLERKATNAKPQLESNLPAEPAA